jgi:hypothetical protein
MANARYPATDDLFLTGQINILTDTINVTALTADYTYNPAHQFYTSAAAHAVFTATLAGRTVTDGVFDADDVVAAAVPTGPAIRSLVIWKNTSNNATSPLIRFIDQFSSGSPILITPNNGNITIIWPEISTRIFRL